ncbi:hypothetical protein [Cytobacillus praedii]|uniref:hypothetical protein n=1 Tax=Cytobacillus praedii TaxID=1742358 RepID=UPI002E23801C|nr:hypothetical protein [Cytobacillus praedii]
MSEKNVFILLTNTDSVLTKLIKLYTKKPYNHASIAFDSDLSEVYSFGRKTARNPFIGGFVKEDVTAGLFKQADCAIYSFTVTEVQFQRMNHYLQTFKTQRHVYRYNFIGLFGVIFNKPITRTKAFFCSQFVASILEECDILHFEKPLSLITPADFQEVCTFQLVYEGKLMDYHNQHKTKKFRIQLPFIPV